MVSLWGFLVIEFWSELTLLIAGKACFCIANTGAGESLTYTLAPILMNLNKGMKPSKLDDNTCFLNSIAISVQPLNS